MKGGRGAFGMKQQVEINGLTSALILFLLFFNLQWSNFGVVLKRSTAHYTQMFREAEFPAFKYSFKNLQEI
jgi:hypothetical protein